MPGLRARKTQETAERCSAILDALGLAYPQARIELDYRSPLELLVAVMLSAQCTDKRVNLVTPKLFAHFRSPADYAQVAPEELYPFIASCGLYRNKAKNIVAMAKALLDKHAGAVPSARAALHALPGVGPKTAGVVSLHLPDGDSAFPVDTHVGRLARRMGLTRQSDPSKVELDLQRLVPRDRWAEGHQLLIFHGRRRCLARAPDCGGCEVSALCPKRGVKQVPRGTVRKTG